MPFPDGLDKVELTLARDKYNVNDTVKMTCSVTDVENTTQYDYRLMRNSSELQTWQNLNEFNFILESVNGGCCYSCQVQSNLTNEVHESDVVGFAAYGEETYSAQ